MKLMLLATMAIVAVTHFPGAPPAIKPAGVVVKADTSSLAGEWFLQPALPSDTATGKLPSLRFNLGPRQFSGFTGCNQMNGSFMLRSDELRFNNNISLGKTECPGYNEKDFIANLLRVNHYTIRNGILSLLIDQTPVARWVRKPEGRNVL